ncbi:hypothetical protein ADUPG1_010494 [Aduncisulcus paluster]|uniref:RRM domain-containing protein n=1 Tax=Aduncisulcus paluster TaxID=2918883 RepID=A0ABQ5JU17_9EUKA|nr:hypothetical protein ADUPG1_010494 [Aduncisulcus paluster]
MFLSITGKIDTFRYLSPPSSELLSVVITFKTMKSENQLLKLNGHRFGSCPIQVYEEGSRQPGAHSDTPLSEKQQLSAFEKILLLQQKTQKDKDKEKMMQSSEKSHSLDPTKFSSEEYAIKCTLYIGNIPSSATEHDIMKLLQSHGNVIKVKLKSLLDPSQKFTFGFVEFENANVIEKILHKEIYFGDSVLKFGRARSSLTGGDRPTVVELSQEICDEGSLVMYEVNQVIRMIMTDLDGSKHFKH